VKLPELTWNDRFEQASDHTGLLKRVILYVILGIGVGRHPWLYAPIDFVAKYAGRDNPLRAPGRP